MLDSVLTNLLSADNPLSNSWALLISAFQLWMLIHAIRQREWIWAAFILFGWGLASVLYFFWVYRAAPSATWP